MDSECIFFIDPVLSILPRNIIYESQKITNVSDICLIFNNFCMVKYSNILYKWVEVTIQWAEIVMRFSFLKFQPPPTIWPLLCTYIFYSACLTDVCACLNQFHNFMRALIFKIYLAIQVGKFKNTYRQSDFGKNGTLVRHRVTYIIERSFSNSQQWWA